MKAMVWYCLKNNSNLEAVNFMSLLFKLSAFKYRRFSTLSKIKKKTYLKEICCCLENRMNNSHLQMVIYYLVIFRFFFGCIAHSSLWVRLQTLIISFPIIAYTQHRRQHKHRMHSHTSAYIHTQINRWRRILFIQTLSANEISE